MSTKHFCQGPDCHTYNTTDRFLKSKGIIRGRYARLSKDHDIENKWYYKWDKYFCSQTCSHDWLKENMAAIERGIPVPFIRERRFTEGFEKRTTTHEGYNGGTYKTSSIERIDNRVEVE